MKPTLMAVAIASGGIWLLTTVALVAAATEPLPAPAAGAVSFAAKPTAVPAGDKVKITFAVSTATDVAVYIENAYGEVIRHLVAGALGANAPAPLKSNSLAQEVEWDGKADYGKPAAGGPFKVRVALGLGANYARTINVNPAGFSVINALGVGPDGTLFVAAKANGAVWAGQFVVALNRDGTYQRTVWPFATNLGKEAVRGITTFELSGRPAPIISALNMGLYGNLTVADRSQLMVTDDGKAIYLMTLFADNYGHGTPQLSVLNLDGGCAGKISYAPNAAAGLKKWADFKAMTLSSDGKSGFIAGLGQAKEVSAVYRFPLADNEKWEVFFGNPATAGKDNEHLGGASTGIADDGKGRLLISDYNNGRILVINETDGKYLAEFPATKPDFLNSNPKNGDLYVSSRKNDNAISVTKYTASADGKDYKAAYAANVPLQRSDTYSMAVDVNADKPVIWAGDRTGTLVRLEDLGDKFDTPQILSKGAFGGTAESYMAIAVDRQRQEVYARNGTGGGILVRYNESTDKIEQIILPGDAYGGGKGFEVMPHPDGNLYGLRWPYCFNKWDRNGKPLPWQEPVRPSEEEALFNSGKTTGDFPLKLSAETSFVPVGMTELPHTLGIRESDGHIFVLTFRVRGRNPKCLNEYLPSGKQVNTEPIIWYASDAVVGPRFDAQGNIYVAEIIKPKGWMPRELQEYFEQTGVKGLAGPAALATNMYGSIVKFTPRGGTFDFGNAFGGHLLDNPWDAKLGKLASPYSGEVKLPTDLRTIEGEYFAGSEMHPVKAVGAEWIHPGIEHVGMFACNCENTSFDVDPFGRVFYPNEHLYRVEVIDTAGNALTTIGGYGNAENRGPDSPIIDAKTGKVRPRLAEEKDLKSPFAKPEIAFAWLISVGVSDKYIYTGDSINRRMLKLKMTYAAEETCAIP